MASRKNIKGITIEINGDVTKLDKALGSVDKSLKTTQDKLKDVEKLLKLDPKNVELLAQKQDLLSQQVEQTTDRYEMLKKAMEESTASNPRYEKWEKAQQSIQGQITKTEKALQTLQKEQKKLEGLGFSPDTTQMQKLQEQIDTTTEKAADLRKQMKDTYEELGRPISVDQYNDLQRELIEAADAMEQASKAAADFSPELATTAANAQEMASKMDGVSSKAKSVSSAFAPVTAGITAIGAAALATVPATEDFRTGMSMLEANAQRAGVSMGTVEEAFRRFNQVSGDTDASIEAISNLLNAGLDDNNLLRAVDEIAGAVISFPDTLKIESLSDSLQETLATGEATGQYGELLERLGLDLEAFNGAMAQTTDLSGKQTIALQELARNGLGELYQGWVSNNEGLIESRDATLEFQAAMADLAQLILPIITKVTEAVSNLITWFTDLPEGVQTTIGVMAALVAVISPIAGIVASIATALGGFAAASGAAAAASGALSLSLGSWIAIIAAVAAAVAGLIALLNILFGKKDDVENMDVGSLTDRGPSSGGSGRSGGPPGFAGGGVFEPNSPMLGILGDNTREREVAAPESMLQGMVDQAVARAGGGRSATVVNIRFTGSLAQLGRVLGPVVTAETQRQGLSL